MTTQTRSGSTIKVMNPPYPPSWLDQLLAWIEELPVHTWIIFLTTLAVVALTINAIFWLDGSLAILTFDPINTAFAIFVVYWALLYRYLTRIGYRALRDYRPLLDVTEKEIDRIEYRLSTLPRRFGWLAVFMGFGLSILTILTDPAPYGDIIPRTYIPYVGDILITGFMISTFFCLLIRSIRQLRMASKLHSRATNINLLELKPAHAFSNLTSRTGIGVILVLIMSYPIDPYSFESALDIFLFSSTGLLAIGIFVLPVIGLQSYLEEEKERALSQTHAQLQVVRERLHDQVGSGRFEEMGSNKDAIEALISERELIKSVSTWPWDPKTIRGFASALLLPLFLGLATQLLERLL